MQIHIKNLRLRTILGIYDWEQKIKQDIIVNLYIDFDGTAAATHDDIAHTVDYKTLKLHLIDYIDTHKFNLIEALVDKIADIVLENPIVSQVRVEVDKPGALRYADSVSVSHTKARS